MSRPCKYGVACYQKSKRHREQYSHEEMASPSLKRVVSSTTESSVAKRSKIENCPEDLAKDLETRFLFAMPSDFFIVWRLAEQERLDGDPTDAFRAIGNARLVGAFDFLAGALPPSSTDDECIMHSRLAVDLPEMQTMIVYDKGHYAYWRDDASSMPVVVHVDDSKGEHFPTISIIGDNLLSALLHLISSTKSKSPRCTHLQQTIEQAAKDGQLQLGNATTTIRERKKKVVSTAVFHGVGIVVPVENDVGYRPLAETPSVLRRTLEQIATTDDALLKEKKMEKVMELVSYVQFANDEMDFGNGLEFGHDLFLANYPEFDRLSERVLSATYGLLRREKFARILALHMPMRRKQQVVEKQ